MWLVLCYRAYILSTLQGLLLGNKENEAGHNLKRFDYFDCKNYMKSFFHLFSKKDPPVEKGLLMRVQPGLTATASRHIVKSTSSLDH